MTTWRPSECTPDPAERALTAGFRYDAHVQLSDPDELGRVVDCFPFPAREGHHRYAIWCDSPAVADELVAAAVQSGEDLVTAEGRVVFWSCPRGATIASPFGKVLARRRYRTTTTNRNLATLAKLLAAAS